MTIETDNAKQTTAAGGQNELLVMRSLVSILEPRLIEDVKLQRKHFGEETEGTKQAVGVLLKAKKMLAGA